MVVQAVGPPCLGYPSFISTSPLLNPLPFIFSGLNEGLVHGQPFPGKLENSEAGNKKNWLGMIILQCHKKSRKKQWKNCCYFQSHK
jgi:hypothetical protein